MKNAITTIQTFLIILILLIWAKNSIAVTTDVEFALPLPSAETNKYKRRMRKQKKKNTVAKKSYRTYRDMPYEDLLVAKDQFIVKNQFDTAIKYLEQMMKLTNDICVLGNHLIEIGDLLFILEKYNKAAIIYTEFSMLYPGNDKAEYALYRAVISSFNLTLSIDRDQTKTEETIVLATTFLEQKHFTTYATEVETIRALCYQKLIENEFYISAFYLKKGNVIAVEKRLANLRDTWLHKLPTIEMSLLTFEADLALQKGDVLMAENKKSEIAQKYSAEDGPIKLAQELSYKRMADRF